MMMKHLYILDSGMPDDVEHIVPALQEEGMTEVLTFLWKSNRHWGLSKEAV